MSVRARSACEGAGTSLSVKELGAPEGRPCASVLMAERLAQTLVFGGRPRKVRASRRNSAKAQARHVTLVATPRRPHPETPPRDSRPHPKGRRRDDPSRVPNQLEAVLEELRVRPINDVRPLRKVQL